MKKRTIEWERAGERVSERSIVGLSFDCSCVRSFARFVGFSRLLLLQKKYVIRSKQKKHDLLEEGISVAGGEERESKKSNAWEK